MAERDQCFDDFNQWVNKASSWLTRHADYNNTEHGDKKGWRGQHFTALCFDAKGRICRCGGDFMRARDEGTFPIHWVWPDEVPAMFARLEALTLEPTP